MILTVLWKCALHFEVHIYFLMQLCETFLLLCFDFKKMLAQRMVLKEFSYDEWTENITTSRRSFKKLCVMMERTRCSQDETVCAVNSAVQFEQLGWAWLGDIPQIIAYTGCILVGPKFFSSTIWQYKELCNHKCWLVIHYLSSWILLQNCHNLNCHILIKNVKLGKRTNSEIIICCLDNLYQNWNIGIFWIIVEYKCA